MIKLEASRPFSSIDLPYLAYFKLAEEPFSTVPSPRFLFLSSTHAMALEKTTFVVCAKKGLAAVFGDTGTGKSSLARLLHQKFLDHDFLSTLITNPNYPTANGFLRTIAQEIGVPKTDRSFKGTLDLLKDFLFEQAVNQHRTVVLILDEAQTLNPALIEVLRQLANYETNDMKLLQIVLFAQDELRDMLAKPRLRNFRSRIVFPSTLEAFTQEQLAAMLQFRWQVASGSMRHPFTLDGIATLYRHTNGIPRWAIILADSALLLAYHHKLTEINADLINQVAADRQYNFQSGWKGNR